MKLPECLNHLLPALALLVLSPSGASAQDQAAPFWPARTADELVVAPSPEAGKLPEVRQAEMDLSSGTATLYYPLMEWSVGTFPMRIGLNYRIGAFTTEELPGWIGLGWSLVGAGSVSRTVMGLPDEYKDFELRRAADADVEYIEDLMDYRTDAAPDRYSYSCPGGSGQFVISGGRIVQTPETNNTIELIGDVRDKVRDFRITTPDGTRYEFTERERIYYRNQPYCIDYGYKSPNYYAINTWQLSRIILPDGADTIRYEYSRMGLWNRNHYRPSDNITMRHDPWKPDKFWWLTQGLSDETHTINTTQFEDQCIPLRIVSRTGSVEFALDRSNPNILFISGMTLNDHSGQAVREVTLVPDGKDRRKLKKITVSGHDGTLLDEQEFLYHEISAHQYGDIFNYPNAPVSASYAQTTVLHPQTLELNPRRKPDFQYAVSDALRQTVSSTGVVTDYEYEPNTIRIVKPSPRRVSPRDLTITDSLIQIDGPLFPWKGDQDLDSIPLLYPDPPQPPEPSEPSEPDSMLTIGIRLKSITQTDRTTGRRQVREYSYDQGICNMDLLTLTRSDFITLSGLQWFYKPIEASINIVTVYDTSSTLLFGSRLPGMAMENARIFYGKVTETVSGTELPQPILSEYEFDISRCPLTRLYGGKEMKDGDGMNQRTLQYNSYPYGSTQIQIKRMGSHIVRGYFREHIGALPELKRRTVYQWNSGEYRPLETEERFYFTSDSMCIQSGLYHEPLVRQIRRYPQEVVIHDLQSMDDISCFDIHLEASSRLLDSIAVTRYYPDGSTRLRTSRQKYAGLKLTLVSTGSLGDRIPIPIDRIPIVEIDPDFDGNLKIRPNTPWNTDSISTHTDIIIPFGEIIREGGHTLEHHTAYSSMITAPGLVSQAASRGLRMLPVREMWVMDGCDTLHRDYDYGSFPGAGAATLTLPIAVTTTLSGASLPVDVQRIHDYTPYGRPTRVSQTGKPRAAYAWGYGGDLIKSISIIGNDFGRNDGKRSKAVTGPPLDWEGSVAEAIGMLRSDFLWQPLIGCTQIRLPSGKTSSFSYQGDRLHRVYDGAGRLLAEHEYELYASTPGLYAGRNLISTTTYMLDTPQGSTATKIFDGFSLAVAEIAGEAGGSGEDVVSMSRYDALGRPVARWLPMAMDDDDVTKALKRDTPLQQAAGEQFADAEALSRITYPSRPGTTPASVTLGGSDFAGHPRLSELTCSSVSDAARRVVRWLWDGSTLTASGHYGDGELDAVMTEDGDGRRTWVFTDCLGRQVLSRSATDTPGRYADTYTVSDPWGNLLLVLPPEASDRLGQSGSLTLSAATVAELIGQYAFIYSYDPRLRLRSKKLPGCEPVLYAYDTENRLIFTRDGNQARQGRRSFMLYDALGRACLTGTCRDALSDDFWLPSAPDMPAVAINPQDLLNGANGPESLTGLNSLDFLNQLNRNTSDPSDGYTDARLLTATFYDDYSFLPAAEQRRLAAVCPASALATPLGLPTGSLTAVLGPDGTADTIPPMLSVSYYDSEERVIASATLSHRGDLLSAATTYTRGGLPASVITTLIPPETGDGTDQEPTYTFTTTTGYDRHGRMLTTQLCLGDAAPITVAASSYDRLGRLQRTEYHGGLWRNSGYDMHGWLTDWHCGYLGQQILYAGGTNPSYSGRVSTKITNSYGHFDSYDYRYDRLGRLTEAAFSRRMPEDYTSDNGSPDADFSTAYSYDLQGNILSLTRRGLTAPGIYGQIDDITATFSGNQLASLRDDAPTVLLESSLDIPEGSWAGSDFSYDANGNQTRDMSRGVAAVEYNDLNLPRRVEFASGGRIEYLYSAVGTKLAERVYDGGGIEIRRRDYVGAFGFAADTLERTLLPEGFVTAADNALHIFIPDYQGNITGVYNSSANALEQFTDYYPYGLPHASATSPEVNSRKYGAKELTTDHGLNLYDFAARWQNPAFPHFTTPDPLAELKSWNSNYGFCGGDPINFIDPTGLDEFEYDKEGHLKNIVPNEDFDAIYILDDDGNRIHASDQLPFGTIIHHSPDEQNEIPEYLEIKDVSYTHIIFEFLASHTNVEWGSAGIITKDSENKEIISTSNMVDTEESIDKILRNAYQLGRNYTEIKYFYYYIFIAIPAITPSHQVCMCT